MDSTPILSIIIPTYNMEEYLPRCLDSLLISNGFEHLEVWVVNDGSTDHSSEIAHQYTEKYPLVFNVIDKQNGNYGSCVNAALPKCRGKYVRLLDADDYFNTQNLERLLTDIENEDADVVLTDCIIWGTKNKLYSFPELSTYVPFAITTLSNTLLWMHHITYKTQLLQAIGYTQTEGISYTDNEWIFYPFFYAKTAIYFNYAVYHYWIGREGQTMDNKIKREKMHHYNLIIYRMLEYYRTFDKTSPAFSGANVYLQMNMTEILGAIFRDYFFFRPFNPQNVQAMGSLLQLSEKAGLDVTQISAYTLIMGRKVNLIRLLQKKKVGTLKFICCFAKLYSYIHTIKNIK